MKIKYAIGALCALVCSLPAFAEIPTGGFGGTSFGLEGITDFVYDCNDGSSGLSTAMDASLWFEPLGFKDRGISPAKNQLSVSLKMSNSALYSWRGYTITKDSSSSVADDIGTNADQASSLWFDTFIAEVQYGPYWLRIAGLEPSLTVNQASLRSLFDPVINNDYKNYGKNELPLPLFHTGVMGSGIQSVIGRNLVDINKDTVTLFGMYGIGMKTEELTADLKVGSWRNAAANDENSWVFGGDVTWKPTFVSTVNASVLGAINYDTIDSATITSDTSLSTDEKTEETAGLAVMKQNPLAFGLSADYNIELPGKKILKPFVGADLVFPTASGYDKLDDKSWEVGGGATWYFRGISSSLKRKDKIGGQKIGDVTIPVGLCVSGNIGKTYDKDDYQVNMCISANEDPKASPLKNVGGFLQIEGMNMTKTMDSPCLIAGVGQLEYNVMNKLMPYIFEKYIPGLCTNTTTGTWVYSTDYHTFTSKVGVKVTPFSNIYVDLWYERTDTFQGGTKTLDDGKITCSFCLSL